MILYLFYCLIEILGIYFEYNLYQLLDLQFICLIIIPFICNLFYNYIMYINSKGLLFMRFDK